MKAATIYHLTIGLIIVCSLVFGLALLPTQARAEEKGYTEGAETYSREELAQMLAPIALYPDALLSQILMASTYPIEVIEADRWRKDNAHLRDEALDDALAAEYWDPSVKALCHFPDILALMSERIGETTDLGNAFLAQEGQVMDTVQQLRAAAHAQGNLASSDKQTVVVEKETIIIQPADPRIIYVPYYDPYTIYGRWWYPAYSPWYWGPPGVSVGFGIGYWPGFYFSFSFGNWSYFDWHRHYVYIDVHKRPRYVRHNHWHSKPGRWQHTSVHRRGVAYRDYSTARKYGQAPRAVQYRRDTRGFPERQELNRNGRSIDRNRQVQQRVDRQRIDAGTQTRQRIDAGTQTRQRIDAGTQTRQRIDAGTQTRQRIDAGTQTRRRIETDRQRATVTERNRQQRTGVENNRSIRTRIERDRQQRDRITTETRQQRRIDRSQPTTIHRAQKQPQQSRVKIDRAAPRQRVEQAAPRQRVERQQRQQPRDNAFNRVDRGVQERQSSERGRSSRQGRQGNTGDNRGARGTYRSGR
jgi:hypothetical protein